MYKILPLVLCLASPFSCVLQAPANDARLPEANLDAGLNSADIDQIVDVKVDAQTHDAQIVDATNFRDVREPNDVIIGQDVTALSDVINLPDAALPDVALPDAALPDVALPDAVNLPDVVNLPDASPLPELDVANAWLNLAIPAQNQAFELRFEIIADADSINGVVGVAQNFAGDYGDLKANIRFASEGTIEARSADQYIALSPPTPYRAEAAIAVVMQIDLNNSRFDVEAEAGRSDNAAFRGGAVSSLNYISLFAQEGEFSIRNITLDGAPIDLTPQDPPVQPFEMIIDADIDDLPFRNFGEITQADLESDFGPIAFSALGDDAAIVSEGGGKALRLRYRPASNGSARRQFRVYFAAHEELWLSYRMQYEPGFEIVKGGKLPGLSGGTDNTGGNRPNGSDGFSARMMWRPANKLVVYLYHPDQPSTFGEDIDYPNFEPQAGVWYTIRERIVMNTNNQYNGVVQTWVDGVPMVDRRNIRYRNNDQAFGIDSFYFSTFYGGNDPSWAPSRDTFIRFDDFKVATASAGVD